MRLTSLVKWPSIESFHNIRKATHKYPHILNGNHKVSYRPKIKLHGTNAAIQLLGNDVVAQSRKTILNENHDNAGFAAWVNTHKELMIKSTSHITDMTVFGEFCGKGINKGCAIHKVEHKIFAIFAVIKNDKSDFIVHPNAIENLLSEFLQAVPNTYVLPWHSEEVIIDWSSQIESLQIIADEINKNVYEVEKCDPWVKEIFGKEGVGEGLVYYPLSVQHTGKEMFSTLAFKAKGEKHKVVKTKAPVVIDPVVAASIFEFVNLVVTKARLEQGVQEATDGDFDIKSIGKFIGWVSKDCSKECQSELEASGLEWRQASKAIANKAREWFLKKSESM